MINDLYATAICYVDVQIIQGKVHFVSIFMVFFHIVNELLIEREANAKNQKGVIWTERSKERKATVERRKEIKDESFDPKNGVQ